MPLSIFPFLLFFPLIAPHSHVRVCVMSFELKFLPVQEFYAIKSIFNHSNLKTIFSMISILMTIKCLKYQKIRTAENIFHIILSLHKSESLTKRNHFSIYTNVFLNDTFKSNRKSTGKIAS